MRLGLVTVLLFGLILGLGRPIAAEEGKGHLDIVDDISVKPGFEWTSEIVAASLWTATREMFIFPIRLADLVFYPPSYYWDYDTGDFWQATRKRPLVAPELRALPAMPRKLKDSEQPRLLPDLLLPDAK